MYYMLYIIYYRVCRVHEIRALPAILLQMQTLFPGELPKSVKPRILLTAMQWTGM